MVLIFLFLTNISSILRDKTKWAIHKMKNYRKIKFSLTSLEVIPIFFTGLLVSAIPLSTFREDLWDGVIIDFNLSQHRLPVLQDWFYSSGWELQYLLLKSQYHLAALLNVPTRNLILICSSIALISLAIEVYILSKKFFKIERHGAVFSGILLLVFPTWNVLASSVMNIHIICLYLGMLGTRLFFTRNLFRKILAVFLILASFQLNSLILFIPTLIIAIHKMNQSYNKQRTFKTDVFLISLLSFSYFIFMRIFNPNYGLYANYNHFVLPTSVSGLKNYILNTFSFTSFLIVPAFALILSLFFFSKSRNINLSSTSSANPYLWLITLCVAASFPYIVVGKSTNLFEFEDWTQRQSFLLIIPISILTSLIVSDFTKNMKSKWEVQKKFTIFLLVGLIPLVLLFSGFSVKLSRQGFERELVSALRNYPIHPSPGIFQINGSGIPGPDFRNYESNYLLFRAYSRASWWSLVQEDRSELFNYPSWLNSKNASRYVFEPTNSSCSSSLVIHAVGFDKPIISVLKYYFGSDKPEVKILKYTSSCK